MAGGVLGRTWKWPGGPEGARGRLGRPRGRPGGAPRVFVGLLAKTLYFLRKTTYFESPTGGVFGLLTKTLYFLSKTSYFESPTEGVFGLFTKTLYFLSKTTYFESRGRPWGDREAAQRAPSSKTNVLVMFLRGPNGASEGPKRHAFN